MTNIPLAVDETFERLRYEVQLLLVDWAIYDQLFNRSKLRYQMLHKCSPAATNCIKNAFETEILMSLSRLTDDPGSGDQERLSFQHFQAQLEQSGEKELAEKLRSKMKNIRKECQAIRDHRNKRVAHLNRKTAMKEDPSPDRIPVETLEKAIKALYEYMSTFQHHYQQDIEFRYDAPITYAGDALVSVLQSGLRLGELIDEKKICPTERRNGKWSDVLKEDRKATPGTKPKIFSRRT